MHGKTSSATLLQQLLPAWEGVLPAEISAQTLRQFAVDQQARLRTMLERVLSASTRTPQRRKSCDDMCDLVFRGAVGCGAKAHVALPSIGGSPKIIPARYCLIRASQIITSHDPRKGFSPRGDYPPIQERRYHNDKGEQLKVRSIAQNPQPFIIFSTDAGASDGPPVVTPTGIALGGNGRSMGVQLSYGNGDRAYADYLRAHAADFGLYPEEVDEIPVRDGDGPMVVRVVDLPRDAWPSAVRALNTSLTQSLDPIAESVAIAKQLPPEALDVLAVALAEDEMDLGEFFRSARSRPFVQALQRVSIITSQNANRMLTDGGLLSDKGRDLLVPALSAAVVPNADLLDAAGQELRNALARSAPYWLAASSYGGDWDLRVPLTMAVRDYIAFRRSDSPTLAHWLQQLSLVEQPVTAGNPVAERLLELLDERRGPIQLSKTARHFAAEAAQHGGGQASLLAAKTPLEVLNEKPGTPQVAMFAEGMAVDRPVTRKRQGVSPASVGKPRPSMATLLKGANEEARAGKRRLPQVPRPGGPLRGNGPYRSEALPRAQIQGGADPTNIEKRAWKRRLQQELVDTFKMPRENAKRVAEKLAAQTLATFDRASDQSDIFDMLVDQFAWLRDEELSVMAIRTMATIADKLTRGASSKVVAVHQDMLAIGTEIELKEHPWAGRDGARRIAEDHLAQKADFYTNED